MPSTKHLTKSNFKLYLECPQHFWVKLNDPEHYNEKQSISAQHKIEQGYEVEELARGLFEAGIEMPRKLIDAIETTKEALNKQKVIYQATIAQDHCLVRADIIVFDQKTKKWNIYEVKSSSEVKKKEHLPDIAFQKIIFEKAGIPIQNVFIVHLNKEYIKEGVIDLKKLFKIENVNEQVEEIRSTINLQIQDAVKIIDFNSSDALSSCDKPKECPCLEICHPNLPEYSIYDISRITTSKHLQFLKDNQIFDINDVPNDLKLSKNQSLQVQLAKKKETIIDKVKIKEILCELEYPLYFLDYETFNSAIPLVDGYKPNQQITFQYSLHVLQNPGAEFKHYEYLAKDLHKPSVKLIKHLQENLGNTGTVIVWNKSFEMRMNNEMAGIYPEYEVFLSDINERVFDLMDIFKKNYYLDYRFKGKDSIKKVMPILVPELSYKTLGIQEGGTAQVMWFYAVLEQIDKLEGKSREEVFDDLLKYCELDTWAMVRIWEKLENI